VSERAAVDDDLVGQRLELQIGAVAHGGHCVARVGNRVVFVRHALPGERVVALITEGAAGARFLRADAVQVLHASAHRVPPPCPYAHPGGCGGCDFQHVALGEQRRLLSAVVAEQFSRLAGIELAVEVEPVAGDDEGLGWRTRVRYAVTGDGRLGLRKHRSHDVVPVDRCRIAQADLTTVTDLRWPGSASVEAVVSTTGETLIVLEPSGRRRPGLPRIPAAGVVTRDGDRLRGRTYVTEWAGGRSWRVSGGGFWQVHPGAAAALNTAVLDFLRPLPGERVLDLFSGVGLFSGALAAAVGTSGTVLAVEGDRRAAADARRNLHDLRQVTIVHGRVDTVLAGDSVGDPDLVVLDPPRVGARREVVTQLSRLAPRAVAYVSCDPVALARDVADFVGCGYRLAGLRAFDIFPMTHHVECVALLVPDGSTHQPR